MPAPAAEITIPVNVAATANSERMHFAFKIKVAADGREFAEIYHRPTGGHFPDKPQMTFDAYELERFYKALGICREQVAAIQERGATFKIG
jgi:hypothetical protein